MPGWRRLFGKGAAAENRTVRADAGGAAGATAVSPGKPAPPARERGTQFTPISGRKPGELLGGVYPVVRSLGRGGFGEVFLCRHPAWNIEVAVKVPNESVLADPRTLSDLQKEAEEWTGLGLHPNIAYCYHLHPVGNIPYLVVEYVRGGTLRNRIESDKAAIHDLRGNLDLAIQLCHALEHAHRRGLIHRDVTPENILLVGDGTAKLTDFGIAKRGAVAGAAGNVGGAQQSSYAGRRGYMAPEQAIVGARIDARADLFALGACLYEQFCFCLPYTITEGPRQEPLRPSDLRRDGKLPPELEQLLLRLVSWEPEPRPPSARAVRRWLAGVYRAAFGETSRYAELPDLQLTASGHNNRGVSYYFLGKQVEAEAALQEALAVDPLHLEANYNMGLMRWRKAKITDHHLIAQIEEIQSVDRGWRPAYLLAQLHLERRDRETAVKLLEDACAAALDEPSIKEALAHARAMPDSETISYAGTLARHVNWPEWVAYSPDGQLLLSGSVDETVRLTEAATGRSIRAFEGHTDRLTSVAFSPDAKHILSASHDRTLRLWDATRGRCLRTFPHADTVVSCRFSPDGSEILSKSRDESVHVWKVGPLALNVTEGRSLQLARPELLADVLNTAATRMALIAAADAAARSGHVTEALRLLAQLELLPGQRRHPEIVERRRRLATRCRRGLLRSTWRLRLLTGHDKEVKSVAFSRDGRLIVSGGMDGKLRVWEVATGRCLQAVPGHKHRVTSVAFSGDASKMLSGSWDNTLGLWDTASGQHLRTFQGHSDRVNVVTFSPDNTQILSGSWDRSVRLWEAATGRCIRELDGHTREVIAVAFSPQGQHVVSGSEDKTLRLWEVATGRCLRTIEGHGHWVNAVAFSPEGGAILSGSEDKTLRLWEAATGRCLRIFEGHSKGVTSIALSRDGEYAFTGSEDETLRLWRPADGQCISVLHADGPVLSVGLSPDTTLALAAQGSSIQIWHLDWELLKS
jgi:WD40 repeat protein/serine/threonine protein kinase